MTIRCFCELRARVCSSRQQRNRTSQGVSLRFSRSFRSNFGHNDSAPMQTSSPGGLANDQFGLKHDMFVLKRVADLGLAQQQVDCGVADQYARLTD